MKIIIPENSVLGIYWKGCVIAVSKEPTIEKICLAVQEEQTAEDVYLMHIINDDIVLEWGGKAEVEVQIDNGEDEQDRESGFVELMPIVNY